MPYHPPDHDEFFRRLGPSKIRKAIVNGDLKGDSVAKARVWLDSVVPARNLNVAFYGMLISAAVLIVMIAGIYVEVMK